MGERGFSLMEMLVALGMMAILATIGSYQFNKHQKKARIEKQTRILYGDLVEARNKALFEKGNRLVRLVSATKYEIYASDDPTPGPRVTRNLDVPVYWSGPSDMVFGTGGMLTQEQKTAICVIGGSEAPADVVLVSPTRVQLGKLDQGATSCVESKVTAR